MTSKQEFMLRFNKIIDNKHQMLDLVSYYIEALKIDGCIEGIEADKEGDHINWHYVNREIIRHWGISGLKTVKDKAWIHLKSKEETQKNT